MLFFTELPLFKDVCTMFVLYFYQFICKYINKVLYFNHKQNDKKTIKNKLMKGKALRKHNLHEKTAASVLLKLFISSNK